jgi:hypothetical protein
MLNAGDLPRAHEALLKRATEISLNSRCPYIPTRNNVFDRNSFENLNVAVSVTRYRALFMDA